MAALAEPTAREIEASGVPSAGLPLIPSATGLQASWPTHGVAEPVVKRTPLGFMRELPVLIIIAFTLAVVLKTFLLQAFYIPSASMEPTLHGCPGCTGDRVLVNKLAYRFREPKRGEVIVFVAQPAPPVVGAIGQIKHFIGEGIGLFRPEGVDYIKRIIGLPGDTIEVTNKGVYITPPHGTRFRLREPYIMDPAEPGPSYGPKLVPLDQFFVMGDNRANSADSRFSLGPVPRAHLIGKAFVKIFPIGRLGTLHVPCYPRRVPLVRCPSTPARSGASPVGAPLLVPMLAMSGAVEFRRHGRAPHQRAA